MFILIINVYSHQTLLLCSTEVITNLQCEHFFVKYKLKQVIIVPRRRIWMPGGREDWNLLRAAWGRPVKAVTLTRRWAYQHLAVWRVYGTLGARGLGEVQIPFDVYQHDPNADTLLLVTVLSMPCRWQHILKQLPPLINNNCLIFLTILVFTPPPIVSFVITWLPSAAVSHLRKKGTVFQRIFKAPCCYMGYSIWHATFWNLLTNVYVCLYDDLHNVWRLFPEWH